MISGPYMAVIQHHEASVSCQPGSDRPAAGRDLPQRRSELRDLVDALLVRLRHALLEHPQDIVGRGRVRQDAQVLAVGGKLSGAEEVVAVVLLLRLPRR